MLLIETIERINERLRRHYGQFDNGMSNWRVSWSEDQFEKRLGTYKDYTPEGIFLREVTEVREVPKYRQWIHERFVLEGLKIVPEMNLNELPVSKVSYEPAWVFNDGKGNYLPPRFEACMFVIETMHENEIGSHSIRYKDPDSDPKEALHSKEQRIKAIQEELFGNETEIGDALAHGGSIIVPRTYGES